MSEEKKTTLHDEIIAHLRTNPDGVSSKDLAERFMKFKNPDHVMAQLAMKSVLAKDQRCTFGSDLLWRAVSVSAINSERIADLSWIAIHIIADPDKNRRRILHLSIWTPGPLPQCEFSGWLSSTEHIPYEEMLALQSPGDQPFDVLAGDEQICSLIRMLDDKTVVFLSTSDRQLLSATGESQGVSLTDDVFCATDLLKALGHKFPRPFSLETLAAQVLGSSAPVAAAARKKGDLFAQCLHEILTQIGHAGIETRGDLDTREIKDYEVFFKDKAFTNASILAQPSTPGVYGFKDRSGSFIYIGKAKNLKRRLMSYFRDTEESPAKLAVLRERSYELITYQCGSELESLLYEYRLIRKHKPELNRQTEIRERKGTFSPIDDHIVLLPHSDTGKGMSFWFRNGQKIAIKPFDLSFPSDSPLISELQEFFFSDKLPAEPSDFPEQEIATRWIKAHRDLLTVVPVNQLGSAPEIYEAMGSYWGDFEESREALHSREIPLPG